MSARTFSLGGFGPKLVEQGLSDVLSADQIAHFDKDDEAISRLFRRGLIPYGARVKAREKLAAKIRTAVSLAPEGAVGPASSAPLALEPVAWAYVNTDGECEQIEWGDPPDDPSIIPLYARPVPALPPLTSLSHFCVGVGCSECAALQLDALAGESGKEPKGRA